MKKPSIQPAQTTRKGCAPTGVWHQTMRILFALISIVLAFTVHLASDGTPQTPISFELARHNPVAIALFLSIGLLIIQIIYDFWVGEEPVISFTLLPVLIALPIIAFTSPESSFHLKVFFAATAYGIFWIAAISFIQRNFLVGFLSVCLAILTVVFLLGFGLMSIGGQAPEETPVGLFQKALIVLFGILCLDIKAQKNESQLG